MMSLTKQQKYTLSSPNICNYLLSTRYKEAIWHDDLLSSFFITLVKPTIGMLPLALLQRLEFLVGSYIYHQTGIEGEWTFSNNLKKMKLVFDFLFTFAEEGDSIRTESFFLTPICNKIKINTESKIWQTIKNKTFVL